MGKIDKNFRTYLIGGLCAAAMTACAPSYQMAVDDASAYGGYGYAETGYGYETTQTYAAQRTRYGTAGLRGSCDTTVAAPCGMMAVVPVYPVYQYVVAPQTPEVPVVEIVEPEPIVVYEPEPIPYVEPYVEPYVYEPPARSWPEPDAPAQSWKPLRK